MALASRHSRFPLPIALAAVSLSASMLCLLTAAGTARGGDVALRGVAFQTMEPPGIESLRLETLAGVPLETTVPPSSVADSQTPVPVLSRGRPAKVWSLRGFVNDLRKPRPPRQRSERPTTGADGIEAMMTATVIRLMLCVDLHRAFVTEADGCRPLTGHYQSLLRPPAILS